MRLMATPFKPLSPKSRVLTKAHVLYSNWFQKTKGRLSFSVGGRAQLKLNLNNPVKSKVIYFVVSCVSGVPFFFCLLRGCVGVNNAQ